MEKRIICLRVSEPSYLPEKQGSGAVWWQSPAALVCAARVVQHLLRLPAGPGSDLSALEITSIFLSVVVGLSWNGSLVRCTRAAARTEGKMFDERRLESQNHRITEW